MQEEKTTTEPAGQDQAEEMEARFGAAEEENGNIRVEFDESEANMAKLKAKTEEIKVAVAEKVRKDSQEHSALTYEDDIIALDVDLRYGRINLSAVLAEMASDDECYKDIITITTTTGLVFVYSDTYIVPDDATAKSLVEEAKFMLASAIRVDSYQSVKLTPVGDIHAMAPDTEPAIIDVILKGMAQEERYTDIKSVTAANGAVYYHSDRYLVDNYAATLLLALAGNHCATIAEAVREESRIYTRPSNANSFHNRQLYGIPPNELEAVLDATLKNPEYSDIKKLVHPTTGAVYLYSDRCVAEENAWASMDWYEVGLANNP